LPKVVVLEGPGAGAEYSIEKAAILGRLETNDIPIKDAKASREHAKIFQQGTEYAIVDLNSSNGTFVNGQKITKRALRAGDEIAIGVVKLRFEWPEADRARAQAPKRKTLDEALQSAEKRAAAPPPAAAAPAGAGDIRLKGHQPLQFSRVKPGRTLLGFDISQLGGDARLLLVIVLLAAFAGFIYLGYMLASR
jgi:pSer/pThr/pTyr-binding forkhead associated (FHA) protein